MTYITNVKYSVLVYLTKSSSYINAHTCLNLTETNYCIHITEALPYQHLAICVRISYMYVETVMR